MSQIVRYLMTFVTFIGIMLIALVVLIFDNKINKVILIISALLAFLLIGGVVFVIYAIGNRARLIKFSSTITNLGNKIIKFFTRGKKKQALKLEKIENFFIDLHQDYLEIKSEKKILVGPLFWSIAINIFDVALLLVAFWALGYYVNPATLFIAFGISSIAGVVSSIPGGAGVYEAVMIAFLASSGVPADMAIAGTLLARVALLSGTVLFGYIFYQLTINKYGKVPKSSSL